MQIAVVLLLVALAMANFAFEWLAIEVFSILVMVVLSLFGILTPQESFMGFANPAIIMVAGVMLLTGGILHNGAADVLAQKIRKFAGTSEPRMAFLLLGAVNGVSAFINNVAATAMFIPVAEGLARRFGTSRGRYLLPVAFASMTGGMCTLIGTSTNLAVAGALGGFGIAPLGMFELTPVGLVVAAVGIVYLLGVAPRLLSVAPEGKEGDAYGIRGFLYEVRVREEAPIVGKSLAASDLRRTLGVSVLAIVRGGSKLLAPQGSDMVLAGDLLLVEGETRTIPVITKTRGLEVKSAPALSIAGLESEDVKMVEATVSFNSSFLGKTLQDLNFHKRFGLRVLAIHRREEVVVEKVGKIPIRQGDVLLIHGPREQFEALAREPTMLLIESVVLPRYRPAKALQGGVIFALAIVASALSWLDAPTAFVAGSALVIVLRVLPAGDVLRYVNLRFLVMLAGMVSLGLAMEKSGAAEFVVREIFAVTGAATPRTVLTVFYGLTVVLTQPLSNAAAALLVLPISIHAAREIGADPRPFAIAVTLAASCSFITPFEPACLLVYGTGRYRFRDFVVVGSLLTLLAFAVCFFLIPRLWPL